MRAKKCDLIFLGEELSIDIPPNAKITRFIKLKNRKISMWNLLNVDWKLLKKRGQKPKPIESKLKKNRKREN